ncbi:MAG: hydantoinase/oxoprolinase family protein [Gaiellaceae bacterium]
MNHIRVSIDVGGTFTDVVTYDERDGSYSTGKVSTTPDDLAEGVLEGLDLLVDSAGEVAFVVHGTTVGLNAFLQRRGERVLLLATQGAGDVYHIARGARTKLYDLHFRKPAPLVPRRDIIEIHGRLNYRGEEIEPLSAHDLAAAVERAREEGIRAIAIAFLFSYLNPAHELEAERIVKEAYPEASVSLSHRAAREWREYERTSTAVLNAYIAPAVERYLGRLEGSLRERGLGVPLHVMQSSGGILTAEAARRRPIQTLLSGPAGGTMGGAALAEILGRPNLLCIDMGGTSFDMSLIVDGQPDTVQQTDLEGLPLLMPIVKIHTIGAGGGSIAYLEGGGLRVGPESAGAQPGPACYGRGGTQPTVTDANLVLGRIDPGYFLGGRMGLDVDAAHRAISGLAEKLDLAPLELAEGILDVINAKMAQAIRTITVEKGIAPSDFAIVAFGGAGPMHAAFLADELEISDVIVPISPGAFSAWGMLQTRLRHDFTTPYYRALAEANPAEVRDVLGKLADEGRDSLRADGVAEDRIEVSWLVDMRYVAQEYSLPVPIEISEVDDPEFGSKLAQRFHAVYDQRYGHANPSAPVEFVSLRATAYGDLGRAAAPELNGAPRAHTPPPPPREVSFGRTPYEAAVALRDTLATGSTVDGPAIIEEETATTVVPPGWLAAVDRLGFIVMTAHGGA